MKSKTFGKLFLCCLFSCLAVCACGMEAKERSVSTHAAVLPALLGNHPMQEACRLCAEEPIDIAGAGYTPYFTNDMWREAGRGDAFFDGLHAKLLAYIDEIMEKDPMQYRLLLIDVYRAGDLETQPVYRFVFEDVSKAVHLHFFVDGAGYVETHWFSIDYTRFRDGIYAPQPDETPDSIYVDPRFFYTSIAEMREQLDAETYRWNGIAQEQRYADALLYCELLEIDPYLYTEPLYHVIGLPAFYSCSGIEWTMGSSYSIHYAAEGTENVIAFQPFLDAEDAADAMQDDARYCDEQTIWHNDTVSYTVFLTAYADILHITVYAADRTPYYAVSAWTSSSAAELQDILLQLKVEAYP